MSQIPRKVLLAVQSDRWRSTLELILSDRCSPLRIRHAADLNECMKQAVEFQPDIVIVELSKGHLSADRLSADRLSADCMAIFNTAQRLSSTLWLAVSDDDLTQRQRLLWVCGISDSCSNISRVEVLVSRIRNHLDSNRADAHSFSQPKSIEERIVQSMPW